MPSLAIFDEFDLTSSSDEEHVDDLDTQPRKDHGDSDRVEEGQRTVARRSKDETQHPDKEKEGQRTVARRSKDETQHPDKENTETETPEAKKAKSDKPVEPVVFFHTWYTDKKGVFRKRRKPNWKVAARKQFGGYFHSRGSKVRSTMTTPAPSSEPEGL